MQFAENFNVNQGHRDYAKFMQLFQKIKQSHVNVMVLVCSFLTFNEILTLTKVNLRMYFVTGNIPLLRSYTRKKS